MKPVFVFAKSTVAEAVPGFSAESWWAVVAPGATPQPAVNRLNAEIRAIVSTPKMRAAFEKEGVEPASMTAGEFAAVLRSDIDKWRAFVRRLNIVPE